MTEGRRMVAGPNQFRAVAGGHFLRFATIAQLIPSAAGLLMLAVFALGEGGIAALGTGLTLVTTGSAWLIHAFRAWSVGAQTWAATISGFLGGLAVTPWPWAEPGGLTAAHAATPNAVAPVLAVTCGIGFWAAAPTALAATAGMTLSMHVADVPFDSKYAIGLLIAWINSGILITLARRGFRLTAEQVSRAMDAESAYTNELADWASRRQRNQTLHDTVLATLDVLAHNDREVQPEQLREACMRDLAVLQGDPLPELVRPSEASIAALAEYADLDSVAEQARSWGLPVEIMTSPRSLPSPPDSWPECVLAIAELLRSARDHSRASHVQVTLGSTDRNVVITVVDDGIGFEPGHVPGDRLGLRESVVGRIHRSGGSVQIWSTQGVGTCIVIQLPVQSGHR